jgi:LCP family protein required for cell wall assembly
VLVLGVFVTTAFVLLAAGAWYLHSSLSQITTVALGQSLTPAGQTVDAGPTTIENYLLVGSDSRAGADPNDPDYGGIGSQKNVDGQRSDSIMVLRYDGATGQSALLSLPRDLWVTIAGKNYKDRINESFSIGRDTLIQTIQQNLGIPIHHYLEVNFAGFKDLVDSVGGVNVYVPYPMRDSHTGLEILTGVPGCVRLNGVQARQYVRSRYLFYKVDGKWKSDETSDYGRMARQQDFIRRAIAKAKDRATNPLVTRQLLDAATKSLTVDKGLDLFGLANRLRVVGAGDVPSYTLPTNGRVIQGKDVLVLDAAAAAPVLDYFKSATGPAPAPAATGSALPAPTTGAAGPAAATPKGASYGLRLGSGAAMGAFAYQAPPPPTSEPAGIGAAATTVCAP